MKYEIFEDLIITARMLHKRMRETGEDYGDVLSSIASYLCMGDRNKRYSLIVLYIQGYTTGVYDWSIEDLYIAGEF